MFGLLQLVLGENVEYCLNRETDSEQNLSC